MGTILRFRYVAILLGVLVLASCLSSPLLKKTSISLDLDGETRGKIIFGGYERKMIYDPLKNELSEIYHGFASLRIAPSRSGEMLYCYGNYRDPALDLYSVSLEEPGRHQKLGHIGFPKQEDLFEKRGSVIASSRSDSLLLATADLVAWIDRTGKPGPTIFEKDFDSDLRDLKSKLSTDESVLLQLEIFRNRRDLYLLDLATGARSFVRSFDNDAFEIYDIAISPDKSQVAYIGLTVVNGSFWEGDPMLKVFSVDNPGIDQDFALPKTSNQFPVISFVEWSPSGNRILFRNPLGASLGIFSLDSRSFKPLLASGTEPDFFAIECYWLDQ